MQSIISGAKNRMTPPSELLAASTFNPLVKVAAEVYAALGPALDVFGFLLLAAACGNALAADTAELSEGEIRKVDKDTAKLTIKHGELKNLDMPAMTMVFQV